MRESWHITNPSEDAHAKKGSFPNILKCSIQIIGSSYRKAELPNCKTSQSLMNRTGCGLPVTGFIQEMARLPKQELGLDDFEGSLQF